MDDGLNPRTVARAKPYFIYGQSERSRPGPTLRFHFFVLARGVDTTALPTVGALDQANQVRAVMAAACDVRADLNSIVHAQAEWNKGHKSPWFQLKAAQTAGWFGLSFPPLPLPAPLPAPRVQPNPVRRTPVQRLAANKQRKQKQKKKL